MMLVCVCVCVCVCVLVSCILVIELNLVGQFVPFRALASRDAKKITCFAFSNIILFILQTHFTTHPTSQFLFLHTIQ